MRNPCVQRARLEILSRLSNLEAVSTSDPGTLWRATGVVGCVLAGLLPAGCGDPCADREACAASLVPTELATDEAWLEGQVGPVRIDDTEPVELRAWRDASGTHAAFEAPLPDADPVRLTLTLGGSHDHPDLAPGTARTFYIEDDVRLGPEAGAAFVTASARAPIRQAGGCRGEEPAGSALRCDETWQDMALDVALIVEREPLGGYRYLFLATFVDDLGDLRLASGGFDLHAP
jgi:hypothetical protein